MPIQLESEYFIHEEVVSALFTELDEEFKCTLHKNCCRKSLHDFLDKQTANSLQSENVLDVTRIFDMRVKAFKKNILMAKQGPMKVCYYHDKVEFQSRY